MAEIPELMTGDIAIDDRGTISFVNGFAFPGVKRCYVVENFSMDTVRAFHGHERETKYVLVVSGSAIIAVLALGEAESEKPRIHRFVLSAKKPAILRIPAGYANGFRPLEPDTKMLFFSTSTLEESKNDDIRFPADRWGREIWEVEDR